MSTTGLAGSFVKGGATHGNSSDGGATLVRIADTQTRVEDKKYVVSKIGELLLWRLPCPCLSVCLSFCLFVDHTLYFKVQFLS